MATQDYINKIVNGDAYELIKQLDENSIDLIITDPPYLIENTKTSSKSDLAKSIQKMNTQLENNRENLANGIRYEILDQFMRVMKKPNIYIWCNHKQIPMYLDYFVNKQGCNFDIILWLKSNATPLFCNKYLTDKEYCLYFRKGGFCNPSSYEEARTWFIEPINTKDKEKFEHPTIKPYKMIERMVLNSSIKGDVILDTFIGSGTTAVACKNNERNFIGFEIDNKWCKIANDRVNGIDAYGQQSLFIN